MVIVIKPKTEQSKIEKIKLKLESLGVHVQEVIGENYHILGVIGDTSKVDPTLIESNECVERVMHVQEPYKKANRLFNPQDTVVEVQGRKIGGGHFAVIAGPCSVESEEQIVTVAEAVKEAGAKFKGWSI